MSDLNKVSLIDTSEEEQASLVQAIPAPKAPAQKEHDTNLLDDVVEDVQPHTTTSTTIEPEIKQHQDEAITMATTTTTAKEEDWEDDKKEHPLASLSLEEYENNDPWAAQPEDNALLQADVDEDNAEAALVQQPVATTTVFDADNRQEPVAEEQLDEDTSATKVNSLYSLTNLKLCLSTCFFVIGISKLSWQW